MIRFGPLKCQLFTESEHSTCANALVERTWVLEYDRFWFQLRIYLQCNLEKVIHLFIHSTNIH